LAEVFLGNKQLRLPGQEALVDPICWMDLCRRAPKRSSKQCLFGMQMKVRSILSLDLRRNAKQAQKQGYQLQMNIKKMI